MATRRFIAGTGVWNLAANWDDGAGGGGAVPLATDDVLFDVGSPACNIDVAAVALTINFTGYLAAITFTNNLTVSGNVTLEGSATYVAGGGSLIINAAATITSDGVSFGVPVQIGVAGAAGFTTTLAAHFTINSNLTINGSTSAIHIINGAFNLNVSGNFTIQTITTGSVSGTTTIVLNGTGTVTSSTTTGFLSNNLTVASAGIVTFLNGGTLKYKTGVIRYIESGGSVVTTGHTLDISMDATTINTDGMSWGNVKMSGTYTITLGSNLSLSELLTFLNGSGITTLTGFQINAGGCSFPNLITGVVTGTTVLNLTEGTFSMNAGVTTGYLGLNITIADNVTFSGTINVGGGNDATGKGLTYASGTPVVTGSNFKVVNGAYTITCNAAGMVFGTLTLNAPTTFAGSYGFTCTEMISSIAEGAATAGDIVSGWDFTSGWTPFNATSLTQNSFVSTGSPGGVYKSVLTLGRRYRLVVTGTVSIGDFSIQSLSSAENYTGFLTGAFSKTVDIVCSTNTYIAIRAESSGATITITSFTIYEIPAHTFQSTEEYIVTDSLKLQGVSAAQPVVLQASTPATPAFIRCAVPVASQLVNNVDLTSYPAGVLTNQAIDASHGRKIYNANGVLGTLSKNFTLNSLWGHLVMTAAGQKVQITSASAGKIRIAQ